MGGPIRAPARAGGRGPVPALAGVLDGPVGPHGAGSALTYPGAAAEPLGPLLRARFGEVPVDSPDAYDRASPLLSALGGLRYAERCRRRCGRCAACRPDYAAGTGRWRRPRGP
ncbi:hypothetical protein ACFVTC_01685 [Streptomyces sp. NPDC057950]|uniref:hypothetical protein n=1 Tax=Streptomyces sp. NPDC057950 TaxID=3346288 RepID=UPI0036EA4B6D